MNTLEFEELNFKCSYPSTWNELNKKSMLRVSDLYLRKLEKQDFLLMAFFAILPTKRFMAVNSNMYFLSGRFRWFPFLAAKAIRKGNKNILPINMEGFAFAKESVEFLTDGLTLTKQLIPSIKVGRKKYFGLKSEIKDMTFGEYIFTEALMKSFQQTNSEIELNQLVAILYKPRVNKIGKRIQEENNEALNKRAELIGSLPLNLRFAAYLFFVGCREYFLGQFKDISSAEEGSSKENNWKDVIFQLTKGSPKDEDINAIMNTRLWNVFELFRYNKKQYEKMKEELSKSKGNEFYKYK